MDKTGDSAFKGKMLNKRIPTPKTRRHIQTNRSQNATEKPNKKTLATGLLEKTAAPAGLRSEILDMPKAR